MRRRAQTMARRRRRRRTCDRCAAVAPCVPLHSSVRAAHVRRRVHDVVVTFEQRVMEAVEESMPQRPVVEVCPCLVVNLEVKDSHEEAAVAAPQALRLAQLVSERPCAAPSCCSPLATRTFAAHNPRSRTPVVRAVGEACRVGGRGLGAGPRGAAGPLPARDGQAANLQRVLGVTRCSVADVALLLLLALAFGFLSSQRSEPRLRRRPQRSCFSKGMQSPWRGRHTHTRQPHPARGGNESGCSASKEDSFVHTLPTRRPRMSPTHRNSLSLIITQRS